MIKSFLSELNFEIYEDIKHDLATQIVLLYSVVFIFIFTDQNNWALLAIYFIFIYIMTISLVVIHEFGHFVIAKSYNMEIRDVTIRGLGGSIYYKRPDEMSPIKHFLMGVSGPITGIVVLLPIILLINISYYSYNIFNLELSFDFILVIEITIIISYVLLFSVLFNLIPYKRADGYLLLESIRGVCNEANYMSDVKHYSAKSSWCMYAVLFLTTIVIYTLMLPHSVVFEMAIIIKNMFISIFR